MLSHLFGILRPQFLALSSSSWGNQLKACWKHPCTDLRVQLDFLFEINSQKHGSVRILFKQQNHSISVINTSKGSHSFPYLPRTARDTWGVFSNKPIAFWVSFPNQVNLFYCLVCPCRRDAGINGTQLRSTPPFAGSHLFKRCNFGVQSRGKNRNAG